MTVVQKKTSVIYLYCLLFVIKAFVVLCLTSDPQLTRSDFLHV